MDFTSPNINGFAGSPGLGWRFPVPMPMAAGKETSYTEPQTHRAYNIDPNGYGHTNGNTSHHSKAWHLNVPLLGRIRILKDTLGLIGASIIVLYWIYGNWSTWFSILIPRYLGGQMPISLMILYGIVSILCITSFIRVSTMNPGSLSPNSEPQADWNVCQRCFQHRPSSTHHCSRCGHCVRKMDHHCPWINNCVGEDNQFAFMLLLFYAYTLSLMTLVLDILHMYFMPPCHTCAPDSFVVVHQSAIMWTAVVMAIMMTCGAFGLYFSQHLSILFDTPSMEWNRIQQNMFLTGKPPEKWPSQKGTVYSVYRTVCGLGPIYLWPLPCRRVRSSANGRHQVYV